MKTDYEKQTTVSKKDQQIFKSTFMVHLFGFVITSIGYYHGIVLSQFNSFLRFYLSEAYGITEFIPYIKLVAMMAVIGAVLSSLTSALLYNGIGRFKSLSLMIFLEIIVNSCYIFPNIYLLYFLRFCSGFIFNFYTFICGIYLNEIMPSERKNKYSNLYPLFLSFGLINGFFYGNPFFGKYW